MVQGGGWCFDQTPEGVVSNCAGRATGGGGSSKYEGPTTNIGGVLSSDPTVNPHFHNWSLVFIHYCDGTSFTCTFNYYVGPRAHIEIFTTACLQQAHRRRACASPCACAHWHAFACVRACVDFGHPLCGLVGDL